MPADWNPASTPGDLAFIGDIMRRLQAAEDRITALEQAARTYAQEATVTAYVSGAYCTVTFDSGTTMVVKKPATYAPTVGSDRVTVLVSPYLDPPQILIRTA